MSVTRRLNISTEEYSTVFDLRWKQNYWSRVLKAKNNQIIRSNPFIVLVPEDKICDQVHLDVDRAYCFDSGFSSSLSAIKFNSIILNYLFLVINLCAKRKRLFEIIVRILAMNFDFKYYQVNL